LYEWYEDGANNRSILETLQSGKQFIFNDDGTFEADSVSTDVVGITGAGDLYKTDEFATIQNNPVVIDSEQTTTSTSYSTIHNSKGVFDLGNNPPATSLYGLFITVMRNDTGGETTSAVPRLFGLGGDVKEMSELELSVTDTSKTRVSTGWTEITTSLTDDFYGWTYRGKVTAGTGAFNFSSALSGALAFAWRVD